MTEVRYKELMVSEPIRMPVKGSMTQLSTAVEHGPTSIVRTGDTVVVRAAGTTIEIPWAACRHGVVEDAQGAEARPQGIMSEMALEEMAKQRRGPGRPKKG